MKHAQTDDTGIVVAWFRAPQTGIVTIQVPEQVDNGWWFRNGAWGPSDALLAKESNDAARVVKLTNVKQSIATLRGWAQDAAAADAAWSGWTQVQKNIAMQMVVQRLGVFFDRFADLIEGQRIDLQ